MYLKTVKRRDLLQFIRVNMYCASLYSINEAGHLPACLRRVGIFLEFLLELFFLFVTMHIWFLYMCTIYVNYDKGDLELFVNCLIQIIIYGWVIIVKLYFRRWQQKKLRNLIDLLNCNYATRSAPGFTYVTMDNCLALSNKRIKLYVYCCFIATLFWLCLPIAHGDRSLPLGCWYPFDYKTPVVYEAMYFLQFVGQIQVAAAFSASSGLHMVLTILISGQYDVLFCSLKNIFATVALESGATKRDLQRLYRLQEFAAPEVNEYYCSLEVVCKIDDILQPHKGNKNKHHNFRYHFRDAFQKCVDHHRFVKTCMNNMENFYSPLWFFKMGEVIFLMCLVAFVSVKSTNAGSSFLKIMSLGQYLFMVTWELLIICYFGEMIHANSQRCFEAILRSPWFLYIPDIKYNILPFLLNAKKPFKLTAGKIFCLNIELFKSVVTTTFSFLTLLQNMDQRNNKIK